MSSYNDLIDSDPIERDPHEHEADADLLGIEDGDGDSDTDAFDTEPLEAFDGDDDTPSATDQPQNERPRTEKRRRDQTVRDDEDTSRADDVDEESEYDEVQDRAEVDETDETNILADITEEPQLRVRFLAQELGLPDPEPDYRPLTLGTGDEDDQDDQDEDGPDQADPDEASDTEQVGFDALLQVDDLVQMEPDNLADPFQAFRWFAGEDVFAEADSDEWFTP